MAVVWAQLAIDRSLVSALRRDGISPHTLVQGDVHEILLLCLIFASRAPRGRPFSQRSSGLKEHPVALGENVD